MLITAIPPALALDTNKSKAVILAYHRIDEPEHSQSSLSFEQFAQHIKEIQNGSYTVLPLPEIIAALKESRELPTKTIAITFEGGYRSTYQNAIPLLIENDLPFTIFIASESAKITNHLNWKTLKKIGRYENATFGILPAQYAHITHLPKTETTRLINKSRIAFKENMGFETKLFSYPFGEISNTLKEIANEQGFTAAFGLQSGPAHSNTDPLAIPRFTMTSHYADIDRFRMVANTQAFPVSDITPQSTLITAPLKQIGFTVAPELQSTLKSLSCHISEQTKPTIEILENRVEIIPAEPITGERTRLNCTLPTSTNTEEPSWQWFGMLFHSAEETIQ